MRLHAILAASLGSVGLSACTNFPLSSVAGCDPDEEQFSVDEAVTEAHIDQIVGDWGHESVADVTCEQVCTVVYREQRHWEAAEIDSCAFELPQPNDSGLGSDGSVQCEGRGIEYWCEGRRPLGHVEGQHTGDALGRACADMAYLEAASVHAFEELAGQLRRFGAPAQLVARCRAAADDERRHARWMSALSARRGIAVGAPRAEPRSGDLLAIARHNAVEGCVHETWAALAAHYRAQAAADPMLRAVFARIALDETRHAQLAWDLHAWLLGRLDDADRASVLAAQRDALTALPALARSQGLAPSELGQPASEVAEQLARSLSERLAA